MPLLSLARQSSLVLETSALFFMQLLDAFILVLKFIHNCAALMVFLLVNIPLTRQVADFIMLSAYGLDDE